GCPDSPPGYTAGNGSAIAPVGIAIAATACTLQQKALARLHFIASRRHRGFPRGAEAGDEARSASRPAASVPRGREAALVVAANDTRAFQKLVFAQQAQSAAPLTCPTRSGDELEAGDAAGKFGLENFDRGEVEVAQMRGCG